MGKDVISVEVVAMMLADRLHNRQLVEMVLVWQECMVSLIGELHQSGVIDATRVMTHLLQTHQSGLAGESGNQVLEVLIGRIASLSSSNPESAQQLLASLGVSDSFQSPK